MRSKSKAEQAIRLLAEERDGLDFQRLNKRDPWRVLCSGLISTRTTDDVTYPATIRLFKKWSTPQDLADADPAEVADTIYPAGFYKTKGERLVAIAGEIVNRYGGKTPDTMKDLTSLKGIGRKIANLVLTLGYGIPAITVDTHVHRICNRTGWVDTNKPDETEKAMISELPKELWIISNELLVRHGQIVCRPIKPRCRKCNISHLCTFKLQ